MDQNDNGSDASETLVDGMDVGEKPQGLSHITDAMWEDMPTPVRQAMRRQAEAHRSNVHDIVGRYKEQLGERQQQPAQQQAPQQPQTLEDLDPDRLIDLGGKVWDKLLGATASGLDEDQAEQLKSLNGQSIMGLIRAVARAEARGVEKNVMSTVSSASAKDRVFGEIEKILPGGLSDAESPGGSRLRALMNERANTIAQTSGEDAAMRYLDDPHALHHAAEMVAAQMKAEEDRNRVAPALEDDGREAIARRSRALQRDGRSKEAFETKLQAWVS